MRVERSSLIARAARSCAALLSAAMLLTAVSCGGGGTDSGSAAATALKFSTQPATVTAGQPFNIAVELVGSDGSQAKSASNTVALRLNTSLTLTGPASVTAVNGMATFSGLTLTTVGANLQFIASSGALSATSAAFAVTPGAVSVTQSSVTPSGGTIPPNRATSLLFTFVDAYGNPLPLDTVTMSSSSTAVTFAPATGTTTAAGTFTTSVTSTATGTATVTATLGGTPVTFPAYTIADLCPPTALAFPGTASGTLPTGPCVIVGVPNAAYRFTTAAAGGVRFVVTTPLFPNYEYEVTTDPPGTNVIAGPATNPDTSEWLLPAGTWQFHIGSATAGAFSAIGSIVPADSGCVGRGLIVPGTYTGQTLAAGDCVLSQVDNSYFDPYVIALPVPCTITMRSTALDAYLYVFDGTGTYITEDDNSGGGTDAQISLPSCAPSGELIIYANTYFGMTGPYTLTIAAQGVASTRTAASSRALARFATPIDLRRALQLTVPRRKKSK